MSWLGNAGWRFEADGHALLVDPYVTRFPTGLSEGSFDPHTPLEVDAEAIRSAVPAAQTILVTHTHWDHFNDVPHLAVRDTARVFGSMSAYHLGAAFGVPPGQLCPVKGGEVLDLGEFVVRVVPGLHSRTASGSVLFPGTLASTPGTPPTTIDGLPEGDTLSFVVGRPDGPRVFVMGASDFVDHELSDLGPDVAALVVPSTTVTHDYLPRLLEGLQNPRTVIPVHWDDFESPLRNPPSAAPPARARLTEFVRQVRRIAPRTRILLPDYLEPLPLL